MSHTQKHNKIHDINETRLALLEQSIAHTNETLIKMDANINQTLARIESRIDNLDKSLNTKIDNLDKSLNARMDKMDTRIEKVENRLWQILLLMVASIITIGISKILHL